MRTTASLLIVGVVALAGCDMRAGAADGSSQQVAAAGVVPASVVSRDGAEDSSEIVVRRIWQLPVCQFWGDPSPDGRYLSHLDFTTYDVAVHDFRTGESRRVTNGGIDGDGPQNSELSTFSPDGRRIAYGWSRKGSTELRIIDVNGGDSQLLYRDESADVNPEEWSDDGRFLLVNIDRHDESRQLGLVSVSDGSLRILKTFPEPATYVWEATISPDGHFVIYDWPANEEDEERDVFVLDVITGNERVLVDHPADDRVLGWAPDGEHVLFASDRSGTMGAWLLPVSDGEAVGEPLMVKPELWRALPLGFDAKGSYYYGVNSTSSDVHVASIDLHTGRLLDSPAPVTNRFTGSNSDAVWSADGRFLAYLSKRSPVHGRTEGTVLVIRSAESGEHREIQPAVFQPSSLDWSPDGQSFLARAAKAYHEAEGLYRIDALTGEAEPLVVWQDDATPMGSWARSANELLLFWLHWGEDGIDNERSKITLRNVQTGAERVLAEYNVYRPAVSQDREWIAYTKETGDSTVELKVLPIAGGEPRTLLRTETSGPEWPLNLVWGPNGRYIYYRLRGQRGQVENDPLRGLWRVPVAVGEPEKLGGATEQDLHGPSIRFQPNGNRIALVRRQSGAEVWVMENFLPPDETEN